MKMFSCELKSNADPFKLFYNIIGQMHCITRPFFTELKNRPFREIAETLGLAKSIIWYILKKK